MGRLRRSSSRVLCGLWLVVLACLGSAHAQAPSPEVSRGLTWLQGRVQADGSLAGEAASVATALQGRSETAQTLAALASVPPALVDAIAAEPDGNTEYLARQAISLIAAGRDASSRISQLLLRRNADRGFGGGFGFESNPLDTAWVVVALTRAGQGGGAVAKDARAYLMASLQSDGGVSASTDAARVEYSAATLFALQTASDATTTTTVRALAAWLLARQGADGSWLGDTFLTAFSLVAVAPVASDPAVRAAASAFLIGRQGASGSWQDDAFLTAVALRALSAGSASPTAAVLNGKVIDQATNLPLPGVSVTVTGAGSGSALTDADGRFSVGNLAAGDYTAQLARAGYAGASASYTIFSGQTLDVGAIPLSQIATTAIVRGRVTAATGGAALAGVAIALQGATALSAITDAAGSFEFSAVPPGTVTLTASIAGYQSASGTASVAGGQTLVFSPSLYTTAETAPTTGRFIGRTVVAGTNAPLAGVAVVLNGVTAGTSAADGRFDFTLSPESYTAVYSLDGYDNVMQGFLLAAGAIVDAGTVALPAQRTTSTITGVVTDSHGTPLAGATVQVLGGDSATAGTDGAYALTGLAGTAFDLRASATGYASQLISVQVSRPADIAQNFALFAGSATFSFADPAVSPASAGANADVTVASAVNNIGSSEASAVVMLQVIDLDGVNGPAGAVVATRGALDTNGAPLTQLTLAGGESRAVRFVWNTGQFAPGRYQLLMRLVVPSSITAATPQGSVLLERPADVAVTAQTHFTGSVTANPPVLRAGTNTAVKLSATIQNDGNAQLPAQAYTLNVVNTQTNAIANTQTATGRTLAVAELDELVFADWTPPAGGNFRVEVISPAAAEGKISTSLYVGDSGSATYATNKLVVPAGTQTVRATVKVTGQDVADGTISDPLAPLVRTAIQKAVSFNDVATRTWTLTNRCMGCHVQSQALIGGELNRKLTTFDPRSRATAFNAITAEQRFDGGLSDTQGGSFATTMTALGLWGIVADHAKAEIASTLKKAADFLLTRQDAAGRWFPDHASGWWSSEVTTTALNLRNLIDTRAVLSAVDPQGVRNWATRPFSPAPNLVSRGFLSVDAAGNLYFSAGSAGRVVQIRPDGTIGTTWTGFSDPRGTLEYQGQMLVATGGGLFRLNADGTSSRVTALNAPNSTILDSLALGPDGKIYSNDFGSHRILQVDPANGFAVSVWFQNAAANGSPLSNPTRLTFTPAGDLLVPNTTGPQNIVRFHPDKTFDVVVELARGQPMHVLRWGDQWLVSTTLGVFRYNDAWEGERLIWGESVNMIAQLADGRFVTVVNGVSNMRELFSTLANVPPSLASYDTAIDRATTFLTNLNSLGNTDNIILAHHLMGVGAAAKYYKASNPSRSATLETKMQQIGSTLRSRVRSDGGWGRFTTSASDSMVTAQVGVALDNLNPSPDDPLVRKAVQLLLARQQADGSWRSENGILPTNQAATSWVAIWLPIILNRLGGIDTDLSVTFPANVAMSNPDKAPTSSTSNPDGTTTRVWKLVGVTAEGQSINYDLTLADLAVNETRAVSTDAHLTFKNSFTGGSVNAPIDVPRVTASAFLDLGVTTDKTTYGANAPVAITGQVTNTDGGLAAGSVKFEIFAADNNLVATVGTLPFSGLAGGASVNLTPVWNTGGTLAGTGYYVLATLRDSLDRLVGTARSSFAIVSDTAALVSAGIATDKPSYLPGEIVRVTSRLLNATANQPLDSLRAVTTVTNPDGSARFTQTETIAQLAQGGSREYGYAMPLGFTAAGVYGASLSVRDAGGAVLATASTSFTVQSSAATGSGLKGSLTGTPKPVPFGDPITFSASVSNLGNADIFALAAKILVVDPATEQVLVEFPATLDVAQLGSMPITANWTTGGTTVGATYVAVLSATVGTVTQFLAQEAFTIAPPVVRVTGALSALPKLVPQGDPVTLTMTVNNVGFGAIAGLPLGVTVRDAATGQVAAQFTASADIALAGSYQRTFSWPAVAPVGTTFVATLSATVNGVPQALAQDTFTIDAPPVKLDVTLERLKQARVLVLLSCKADHDHDSYNNHVEHGSEDGDGHDHGSGYGHDHGHHDGHHDSVDYDDRVYQDANDQAYDHAHHHDADHDGPSAPTCVQQRKAFLEAYLADLGAPYLITTGEAEFRKAFRSGAYNTYWITGGSEKLKHELDEELREAVNRGDALIVDAVHDERNHGLDAVLGIKVRGKLNPSNQAISFTGSVFPAGQLATVGRPLRVALTSGQAQAFFARDYGRPAVVSNVYGLGRSLLFAFDLVGTLMAQPQPAARGLGRTALEWIAPDLPAIATAGDYAAIHAKILNLARAVEIRATLTLPAGATLVGTSPSAAVDGEGRAVWTQLLQPGQSVDLDAAVRLPGTAGSHALQLQVEYIRDGVASVYGTYGLSVAASDAAQALADATAGLQALALQTAERSARDRALQHLASAKAKLGQARWSDAIDELLEAVEDLARITSVDTWAYRLQIDRALHEAEYRWWLALPQ